MITPIPMLVFVFALTLVVTSSIQVGGQIWTPCGIRGGTSLPVATKGASMKHCFLNRSTILDFNAITDEDITGLNATIHQLTPNDVTHRRENESRVKFLCRGLVLMNSFIHELDYADEASLRSDVATLKHRFVVASNSLNTSLTTMITKCPLLIKAPLQLEEMDTQATVSLATERSSDSNWMTFLNKVQTELKELRATRYIGTDRRGIGGNGCSGIFCVKGIYANRDHRPVTGEDDWD